jgi:peptidoglycan/xylan/chitin deacetylase (PgdA/CDA1 family)
MPSFRLDRFLTLYFFHPLIRKKGRADDKKIPILMYHSISDDKESAIHPYYHINTSLAVFAEHMRFLAENNYTVIDLQDLKNINPLPPGGGGGGYVVITFDDGYLDFHTNAFPILQKYHFPATVFLPTGFIGTEKNKLRGKDHLTWSQVSELSAGGISFGSHTVSHPQLHDLGRNEIEHELRDSKKSIEDKTGKPVKSFSYPFAFPEEDEIFRGELRNILKKNDYAVGVTTIIGRVGIGDDPLFLKRIPINNGDDELFFRAKLEGAYDWPHKPQYFYKIIKRRFRRIV